jgi:hypothetical protein
MIANRNSIFFTNAIYAVRVWLFVSPGNPARAGLNKDIEYKSYSKVPLKNVKSALFSKRKKRYSSGPGFNM